MRIARLSDYARVVSSLIESTNNTGEKMGKYFTPLKDAIKNKDISKIDLKKTKSEFQSGTDVYKNNLKQLKKARVPARVLGKHKMMIDDYENYVNACQSMTDSINVESKKINQVTFSQAEKDQDHNIVDFVKYAQKIMMG